MFKWVDATGYRRGERGKVEPKVWEISLSEVRIWVGCNHIYYPDTWVVQILPDLMDCTALGSVTEMSAEEAQKKAIQTAINLFNFKARTFDSLVKELEDETDI